MTPATLAFVMALNLFLGTTYFATKKSVEGLPEFSVVLVRAAVAVGVLVPLAGAAALRALFADRRGRGALFAMGGLGLALPLVLGNFGVARSTAVNASLLIGVEPLCVALLGALVLRERLSSLRCLALGLGLLGATAVVANGLPLLTVPYTPHLTGDLLLLAHAAAWAIYSIAGKPLLGRHPPLAVTAGALLVSLPLLAPFAALEWPRLVPGPAAWRSLGWTVALGLFASGAGAALWNLALRRLAASQLAGFVFLQPLAGVALGVALLDEPLTRWAVGGGTLVFAGVYALVVEARSLAS